MCVKNINVKKRVNISVKIFVLKMVALKISPKCQINFWKIFRPHLKKRRQWAISEGPHSH